jgi:hypothetical protein
LKNRKAYLTWVDFESVSQNLDFGIQDNNQDDQNSSDQQNPATPPPPSEGDEEENENLNEPVPEEVNALYERLLQEMESKSEPLEQEVQAVQAITSGRDY